MLQAAKAYQTIFDTINKAAPELAATLDPTGSEKSASFQNFVLYLLISPYDNEKVDMLHILEAMYARELETEDLISKFVRKLLTFELMPLNEAEIEQQMAKYEPFLAETKNHKTHLREFLKQLIQHNIRVVEKYYSRV